MRAIFLAGGQGTRLRPLSLTIPKPFLPVANIPILAHQIEMARRAGADAAVLCLSYKADEIASRIEALGSPLPIRALFEDPPMGTGGAVREAALEFGGEAALVLNGDALSDADLAEMVRFHRERGASCTILTYSVEDPQPYGIVETGADGRVIAFREKVPASETPFRTINAGAYVIEPRALRWMPEGSPVSIERQFFPELLSRGEPVFAREHRGYWIDVGSPSAYLRVHRDIFEGAYRPAAAGDAVREGRAVLGEDTHVFEKAHIGANVTLGRGVRVEREAWLEDVVALEGVRIGAGARVCRAVLGPGVRIGAHAVAEDVVLGEGSVLSDHSRAVAGAF